MLTLLIYNLTHSHDDSGTEFRKHKDFLIHTVKNCAIGRLRTVRLAEISTICASYRSRVPPHDWWRCPPPAALMDAPCFQEYINQSIAHATTFDQDPISLLPQIANDWIEDRRRALYRAIGLGSKVLANDSLDELNLAKCVFVCMQCRSGGYVDRPPVVSLCGWRRACTHMCHIKSKDHTLLEFSWRGEEVVTAMLESLGMDPGTTTAQEMDDLDMRFLCGDCEIGTHRKGILGKKVYTWAECVRFEGSFLLIASSLTGLAFRSTMRCKRRRHLIRHSFPCPIKRHDIRRITNAWLTVALYLRWGTGVVYIVLSTKIYQFAFQQRLPM